MAFRWTITVLVALVLSGAIGTPSPLRAQETLDLMFDGVVEPLREVEVSNHLNGIVDAVNFAGGEDVVAGQVLFVLERERFVIEVEAARAALEEARARLALAEDAAERQAALLERGTGVPARAVETAMEVQIEKAELAQRESALARAELDLRRTQITAPIDGRLGRPLVARGAFVEAEAGSVLARIVQLDPVLVAYGVSYEARQQALAESGASTADALFSKVTVKIALPSGEPYPVEGRPRFESARIDPQTGLLTTWAEFANPNGVLVPGLNVRVRSSVSVMPGTTEHQ